MVASVCASCRLRAPEKILKGQVFHRISKTTGFCHRRSFSIKLSKDNPRKERVVILGSGWAGYAFARTLDPSKYERIVVSPRSYFVFTPLLASTTVGTLEFRAVLEPIRRIPGVRFHQGWADEIDFNTKTVRVEPNPGDDLSGTRTLPPPISAARNPGASTSALTGTIGKSQDAAAKGDMFDVPYDKLVIAVGAYSQTFGIEGVRQHAHFLRDIGDARRIRLRVLSLFEQCSYPSGGGSNGNGNGNGRLPLTDAEKRELLHFAIVGGGPTGIEFAAELHDLVHEDLKRLYPDLVPLVRITVYDVAPKVLPMFDAALAKYATEMFARQGIDVRTEHHLERVRTAEGDELGGRCGALKIKVKEYGDEEVGAGIVVWSTGLMANPLVEKLLKTEFVAGGEGGDVENGTIATLAKDEKTGGIVTDKYLRARISPVSPDEGSAARSPGEENPSPKADEKSMGLLPDVFVLGDCAVVEADPTLPKTAQVASQQALHLARMMNRGNITAKPFAFTNWGTMTYLGSWKAIHQSSADELRGWLAWVLWRGAYLTKSMSVRNKIMVPVYWMVSWLFGRDISRF